MPTRPDVADCGLQLLRLALARHRVLPDRLDEATCNALLARARQARVIERRALAGAPSASGDVAMAQHLTAFDEAIEPYTRHEALSSVGLDEARLAEALGRELAFDRLARKASADVPPVTAGEIARYYRENITRFAVPERRVARQILVTVNELIAENHHAAAHARIEALHRELAGAPEAFPARATEHSECPSALREGLLGVVTQGQLYPELDRALFTLEEGAVSAVLESPLGFHLLRCERILPPTRLELDAVAPHIRRELTAARQRCARRAWLDTLATKAPGLGPAQATPMLSAPA